MSSFRPRGVTGRTFTPGNRQRQDYPIDRIATVDGYDLNRGVLLATEQKTNKKLEVTIQHREAAAGVPAVASHARNNNERKWSGNKIDALMAEALTPGSWVILEKCRGNETVMKGNERTLIVSTGWISNVSEPRPDKCFQGVLTVSSYKDAVDSVQCWDEKAMDANDADALKAFGEELDRIHTAFSNRERPVRRGFQFRIVKEVEPATEGRGGKPGKPAVYEAVDMSYPIDWIKSESEDPDNYGAPPTSADLFNFIDGYTNHVWGSEPGAEEVTQAKFSPEELEKMRFEVVTYRHFKAGDVQYNDRLRIPQPEAGRVPSVLYTLANTPTRYSEDDDQVVGKNWAVRGILQLINDTFDKKSVPPQIIPNHMVRQVFYNGPRANVQAMIASSDGGRVKVAPSLDRVLDRTDRPAPGTDGPANSQGTLAPAGGDALSGAEQPFGPDGGDFLGLPGADADAFFAAEPPPAEGNFDFVAQESAGAVPAADAAPPPAAEDARFRRRPGGRSSV